MAKNQPSKGGWGGIGVGGVGGAALGSVAALTGMVAAPTVAAGAVGAAAGVAGYGIGSRAIHHLMGTKPAPKPAPKPAGVVRHGRLAFANPTANISTLKDIPPSFFGTDQPLLRWYNPNDEDQKIVKAIDALMNRPPDNAAQDAHPNTKYQLYRPDVNKWRPRLINEPIHTANKLVYLGLYHTNIAKGEPGSYVEPEPDPEESQTDPISAFRVRVTRPKPKSAQPPPQAAKPNPPPKPLRVEDVDWDEFNLGLDEATNMLFNDLQLFTSLEAKEANAHYYLRVVKSDHYEEYLYLKEVLDLFCTLPLEDVKDTNELMRNKEIMKTLLPDNVFLAYDPYMNTRGYPHHLNVFIPLSSFYKVLLRINPQALWLAVRTYFLLTGCQERPAGKEAHHDIWHPTACIAALSGLLTHPEIRAVPNFSNRKMAQLLSIDYKPTLEKLPEKMQAEKNPPDSATSIYVAQKHCVVPLGSDRNARSLPYTSEVYARTSADGALQQTHVNPPLYFSILHVYAATPDYNLKTAASDLCSAFKIGSIAQVGEEQAEIKVNPGYYISLDKHNNETVHQMPLCDNFEAAAILALEDPNVGDTLATALSLIFTTPKAELLSLEAINYDAMRTYYVPYGKKIKHEPCPVVFHASLSFIERCTLEILPQRKGRRSLSNLLMPL